MDASLVPATAPGRQLAWLMGLTAEPSPTEIQDHLLVAPGDPKLASGLLAFGTTVRALTGEIAHSDDTLLRLVFQTGDRFIHAMVSTDPLGSGKIWAIGIKGAAERDESERDRIQLLYDRAAGVYEQYGGRLCHYWDRARTWLREAVHDDFTVLDVGCGPGHLIADLPPSVRVIGCDLSPEMLRLADLARPDGTFVVHDYHVPFPTKWPRPDVTVALGCLDFCSDLPKVARNLATVTKPGGRLLLTVPWAEPSSPHEINLPAPFEAAVRLREDAEVAEAFCASGLDVVAHDITPGFTSPGIGTVEYGFWELRTTRRR
jgi:malonyl-CoA O-methyltransferase